MSAADSRSTDLVPFTDYSLAKHQPEQLLDILHENVGTGALSAFDLERVKVPLGGGRTWSVPTLTDDPLDVRNLDGIIVYHREPRAFWAAPFGEGGGNTPPDCASQFGDHGVGTPGIECAICPNAEWGSKPLPAGSKRGTESRGQACKQMKLTFLLRDDALLPLALFLPPTSLVPMRKYLLGLASRGRHYSSVITRLALDATKNADGVDYSVVKPTMLTPLDEADAARIRAYSEAIKATLDTVTVTVADVEENGGTGE